MSNLAYESDTPGADREPSVAVGSMDELRPVPRITIQAFCETDGVAKPIENAGEDRRMFKTHLKVLMGGLDAAIDLYQSSTTPNLILLESKAEPKELLESLSRLAEVCDPTSKVIVIGHYNDVWLYRELIKSGVSEYIVAPLSIADIIGTIYGIFVDPDAAPIGKSIAFIGAKGGVGSSTIAHNVAWSISTLFDNEVVVADMDLPFGTANINFDQDPAQGIAEAVFAPERIDDVYLDRLLAQCSDRLSLLAAPSTLERVYDFDSDAFSQLIDVAQRSAPNVVLDVPHVWNGWTKNVLKQADEIIVTATPELANLRNTKNLIDTLKKLRPNDGDPHLILNQTGVPKRPEISPDDFADPLEIQPLAVIPFDPPLFGNASNSGRMLAETDPQNDIVSSLYEVAHAVTGRAEPKEKKKSGLDSILAKLKLKK